MVNFNPIDYDYIVRWQSDLENTKESILPVCDKPYHKIKENVPLGEELEILWNYPFQMDSPLFFLNVILEWIEVRHILICWALSKATTSTIFVTSLVWLCDLAIPLDAVKKCNIQSIVFKYKKKLWTLEI